MHRDAVHVYHRTCDVVSALRLIHKMRIWKYVYTSYIHTHMRCGARATSYAWCCMCMPSQAQNVDMKICIYVVYTTHIHIHRDVVQIQHCLYQKDIQHPMCKCMYVVYTTYIHIFISTF